MNCAELKERVEELVDGLLPPEEAARYHAHAAECIACAAELRSAIAFRELLAGPGREALDLHVAQAVSAAARRDVATRLPALRGRRLRYLAAAAVLLPVAALLWSGWPGPASEEPAAPDTATAAAPLPPAGELIPVRRGERYTVKPGRAFVADDDDLKIRVVPESGGECVFMSAGSAFFQVEPGRSFAVETPQGVAEVLGTSFHVRVRKGGDVTLAVTTGTVRFTRPDRVPVVLRSGSHIDVDRNGRLAVTTCTAVEELELLLSMRDIEIAALRGELARREEDLAVIRNPDAQPHELPLPAAAAPELPWDELGRAMRVMVGDHALQDPQWLGAWSVYLKHADAIQTLTDEPDLRKTLWHPRLVARTAPSFFAALAPEAAPDLREAAVAEVARAAEAADAEGALGTPAEQRVSRLQMFRTLLSAAERLGAGPAAEVARGLRRIREGAWIFPKDREGAGLDLVGLASRHYDLMDSQKSQVAGLAESYVEETARVQQELLSRHGEAVMGPILFPVRRLFGPRPDAEEQADEPAPALDPVAETRLRLEVKLALLRPRVEFERAVDNLLRQDQRERGYRYPPGVLTFRP